MIQITNIYPILSRIDPLALLSRNNLRLLPLMSFRNNYVAAYLSAICKRISSAIYVSNATLQLHVASWLHGWQICASL